MHTLSPARPARATAPRATALLATLAALAAATPLGAQERHVLTGGPATIWNLAGEVRLEAGTGNDVVVELTRGGSDGRQLSVTASGAQLKVRYPDTDIVYTGGDRGNRGSTTLTVREDGTFGGGWGDGRRTRVRTSGSGLEAHADLRVLVPRGKRLTVHLAVGEVVATNVDGDITIDVHSARTRATGTKGRLMVDAGSGSVRVEDGEGELEVDTGSGSTTILGFRGRSIEVDAGSGSTSARDVSVERFFVDVGSGSINAEGLATDDLEIDTGSGSVEVRLSKVPRRSNIDTGSGGVRLGLPANANADLDIDTGSGGISSDFPVTVDGMRRRELRGKLGDGGPVIRVSTGSGGVRLIKL